jgi:hypothetical protein
MNISSPSTPLLNTPRLPTTPADNSLPPSSAPASAPALAQLETLNLESRTQPAPTVGHASTSNALSSPSQSPVPAVLESLVAPANSQPAASQNNNANAGVNTVVSSNSVNPTTVAMPLQNPDEVARAQIPLKDVQKPSDDEIVKAFMNWSDLNGACIRLGRFCRPTRIESYFDRLQSKFWKQVLHNFVLGCVLGVILGASFAAVGIFGWPVILGIFGLCLIAPTLFRRTALFIDRNCLWIGRSERAARQLLDRDWSSKNFALAKTREKFLASDNVTKYLEKYFDLDLRHLRELCKRRNAP